MSRTLIGSLRALAQWRALAVPCAAWGTLLFLAFGFWIAPRPPGSIQYLVLAVAAFALAGVEFGLLLVANTLLELMVPRRPWAAQILDFAKAVAIAGFFTLLALSVVKYQATKVHLKASDFWFLFHSLGQITQEATETELATLVGAALLMALGTAGLYALMARGRRAATPRRPWLPLALAGVAMAALFAAYATVPLARVFTRIFFPETSWLARNFADPDSWRPTGASAEPNAPGEAGGSPPAALLAGSPIRPYEAPNSFRSLNVIFLMLESISWSRLLGPEARPGVAPNLEALAAESVVFPRAYAVSTHSDYAQTAILSSLYPRKFNHHDYFVAIDYPRTLLWDLFKPLGYRTSIFSSQNEEWGNMVTFHNTAGLDLFRHAPDWPNAARRGDGRLAKVFEETPVEAWMRWREAVGEAPYATYLNFQATHYPYVVPPSFPHHFEPSEINFPATFVSYPEDRVPVFLNRFYNALHYVDSQVGRVVEFLKRRGDWEHTVLVVVADHGEAFYEHGLPTHGSSLFEEQARTVLLIHLPGEPPRMITQPVSVLDILPTVARFLSLPPHGNFQGRSDLLDPGYEASQRSLFFCIQGMTFEDGLLAGGFKYLVNWDRRESRLFFLPADPDERIDLASTSVDERDRLEALLRGFLARQTGYYQARGWERGYYPPPVP